MLSSRTLAAILLGVALSGHSCVAARSLLATAKGITYVLAIFGDSQTDTGNTFRLAGVPDPAFYWNGRCSDGPNWVDHLNATLSKTNKVQVFNYAYTGASACPSAYTAASFPFIKDLDKQTADFLADIKSGRIPQGRNVRIIPLQLMGANDILPALKAALATGVVPSAADISALVGNTVACRLRALQAAAEAPGVRDAVLLPMLPVQIAPGMPEAYKPMVKSLIDAIDAKSGEAVKQLQSLLSARPSGSPGARVRVHAVAINTLYVRGSKTAGIKNVTEPCMWNPGSVLSVVPNLTVCKDPADHVFYDDMHISTLFHEWVANKGFLPRLQQLRVLPTDV